MPKAVHKLQQFHGGLNSNADPRDLLEGQSPSLVDCDVSSPGRIKLIGKVDAGTNDGFANAPVKNTGLFVMSSDRKLDKTASNETLIFNYDGTGDDIDAKDSDGWDAAVIDAGGAMTPVYYAADGVLRVSDATFVRDSQWFGYIDDQRFTSLNGAGPAADWFNVPQSLASPTLGKCLTSTPVYGTDTNGINSSYAEYVGNVIDDATSTDQVASHTAVNLRVGVQLNDIIVSGHAAWTDFASVTNPSSDASYPYPIIGTATTFIEGTSTPNDYSAMSAESLDFSIGENQVLIVSVFITSAEYNKLTLFRVLIDDNVAGRNPRWDFGAELLSPDKWNLLVCGADNISEGNENFPCSGIVVSLWSFDNTSAAGAAVKMDYYVSGIAIAESQTIDAFVSGTYTFHYSWLYDDETKQESLPFQFSNATSDTAPHNANSINVAGLPVLFNFDSYILPFTGDGNTYSIDERISGARLYWKIEENDNYFLVGDLDFIDKGFKWLPDANTNSYTMTDTTSTSGSPLGKMALVKGISPDSANTIDTFKNLNGFSSEVKSLDAKYKTAVVQGRRVYIGNIEQDDKAHPDRILKSRVNRFDTFPSKMGVVDVAIRDGENIVMLETYADRILQFKENSLYIINVSETIDFLEDTYRNKGCAFPYHVTKTDSGISWFNQHGVFLYDGKQVHDLLEKNGVNVIGESTWATFIKDGTDDTDMSSAMIGYIPKTRQLIIKNENNDIYMFDFVLKAWTTGIGRITESTNMTNFALDADQDLFYIDNTTTVIKTWQTTPTLYGIGPSLNFEYKTADMDFGEPGVRKKIYKVYITYTGGLNNDLDVTYGVDGATPSLQFDGDLDDTSGDQVQAELKPSASINNIKSLQLKISGTAAATFEINDISVVYRMKNIK